MADSFVGRLLPAFVRLLRRARSSRANYFCIVRRRLVIAAEMKTAQGEERLAVCADSRADQWPPRADVRGKRAGPAQGLLSPNLIRRMTPFGFFVATGASQTVKWLKFHRRQIRR